MDVRFIKNTRGDGEVMAIDDARILYPNFQGRGDRYNREGDKLFQLKITDGRICKETLNDFNEQPEWIELNAMEMAEALIEKGYNVSIKEGKEPGDEPYIKLKVKVAYKEKMGANGPYVVGPEIYLDVNGTRTKLDKDSCGQIDQADLISCDMDIRQFHWEDPARGESGNTAYLNGLVAYIRASRFSNPDQGDVPF